MTVPGFTTEELARLFNSIPPEQRQQLIDNWKEPGVKPLREAIPKGRGRIEPAEYLARVRQAQKSGMQSFALLAGAQVEKNTLMCVVGGGPSLKDTVHTLRKFARKGARVMAANKSHDFLLKQGIPVHYAVLLDPKEWVADYIDPMLPFRSDIAKRIGGVLPKYLIASQCHERTLAKFAGNPHAFLWHGAAGLGETKMLADEFKGTDGHSWACIPGPSVVGLRCVYLSHALGVGGVDLFGIDGSGVPSTNQPIDGKTKMDLYAYDKPFIDETWHEFTVKMSTGHEKTFVSNHHMARSVYEFEDMVLFWDRKIRAGEVEPFHLKVHGDPERFAIPFVAAGKFGIHANPAMNEKYRHKIVRPIEFGL